MPPNGSRTVDETPGSSTLVSIDGHDFVLGNFRWHEEDTSTTTSFLTCCCRRCAARASACDRLDPNQTGPSPRNQPITRSYIMGEADGPLRVQAYVCNEKGGKLQLQDIELPPLKATQVEIDMTHCGVCHTDVHMRDNDWGVSDYPLVLGHEGVGFVRRVGDSTRKFKVGEQVGVSWIRDSCSVCTSCLEGKENLCKNGFQGTYLGKSAGGYGKDPHNEHGGCFSKVMRVEERFVFKVPGNITPEIMCPLLCGGSTVFEPICDYVHPGSKVGIVSIGGLGTVAIKLAKLYGGKVTAFSSSAKKKDATLAIGAEDFVVLTDKENMAAHANQYDLLIDTTPINHDFAPLMDLLTFDGVYCRVGVPAANDQAFSYGWIPLVFTKKKICGSVVSGCSRITKMVDMVSSNLKYMEKDAKDWRPQIMPFSKVNEALDMLQNRSNKGYRIMLKW